jgi:serine/threonine-protein kinase HipA
MTPMFDIYLLDQLVGSLSRRRDDRLIFTYESDYVSQPGAAPIFMSLPLQGEPFGPAVSRAVFEGLVPENADIRQQIARIYETSSSDFWGLMSSIGRDCAGALSIVRSGDTPPKATGTADDPVDWLTGQQLAEELSHLRIRPLGAHNNKRRRISLAGYQEKMAVRLHPDGQIGVPLDGCPSTHILKPERSDCPGLAANEHFCLMLASASGLAVAATALATAEDVPYLMVTRYDRLVSGHNAQEIHRIHQYDFCQAMGYPPHKKYQDDGGPSVRDCLQLLLHTGDVVTDTTRFLQALAFNVMIGNCDAHSKNYSFLMVNNTLRFAPLYDIFCTKGFHNLTDHMAMKIGDVQIIDRVRWLHWQQMAAQGGIDFEVVRLVVRDTASRMLNALPALLDAFRTKGVAMEQPEKIAAFARHQIAHVLEEAP